MPIVSAKLWLSSQHLPLVWRGKVLMHRWIRIAIALGFSYPESGLVCMFSGSNIFAWSITTVWHGLHTSLLAFVIVGLWVQNVTLLHRQYIALHQFIAQDLPEIPSYAKICLNITWSSFPGSCSLLLRIRMSMIPVFSFLINTWRSRWRWKVIMEYGKKS